MKKKIIGVIAVAAIAVAAGWGYQQNKNVELSDLALENVEALANGEWGDKHCATCSFSTSSICWMENLDGCLGHRMHWV